MKSVVATTIANIIFFFNEKYNINKTIMDMILVDNNVCSSIPSGTNIIFVITETIIPMEIHSIQSKKFDFIFTLFDNFTPKALQLYVAKEAKKIEK